MACSGQRNLVAQLSLNKMKTYRLGWNAIPFAREDFDSNYNATVVSIHLRRHPGEHERALVSMFGEDCILREGWPEPHRKKHAPHADQRKLANASTASTPNKGLEEQGEERCGRAVSGHASLSGTWTYCVSMSESH